MEVRNANNLYVDDPCHLLVKCSKEHKINVTLILADGTAVDMDGTEQGQPLKAETDLLDLKQAADGSWNEYPFVPENSQIQVVCETCKAENKTNHTVTLQMTETREQARRRQNREDIAEIIKDLPEQINRLVVTALQKALEPFRQHLADQINGLKKFIEEQQKKLGKLKEFWEELQKKGRKWLDKKNEPKSASSMSHDTDSVPAPATGKKKTQRLI